MYSFGAKSLAKLKNVHPNLAGLLVYAIKTSEHDFSVDYGVRTAEKQQELYSYGRTVVNPNTGPLPGKPMGAVVTNKDGIKNKSNHQLKDDGFGYAVDIYPYYNGKMQTGDEKTLVKIIAHVKKCAEELEIACTFGMDWKNPYDPPHIELK